MTVALPPIQPGQSAVDYIIAEAHRKGWHFWYLEGLGGLLPPPSACGSAAMKRAYDYARTRGDQWLRKLAAGGAYGYRDEYTVPEPLRDVVGTSSDLCFTAWFWQIFPRNMSQSQADQIRMKAPGIDGVTPTPAYPALWVAVYRKEDPRREVMRSAEQQGADPQSEPVQQQAEAAGVESLKQAKPAIMADLNAQQRAAMANIQRDNASMLAWDRTFNEAFSSISAATSGAFGLIRYLPWIAGAALVAAAGGYVYKAWR